MKVPYAKSFPTAYELLCPHCGETIPNYTGSLYWTKQELQLAALLRQQNCDICHLAFKLPKPRG